jgi:hypothetical protein
LRTSIGRYGTLRWRGAVPALIVVVVLAAAGCSDSGSGSDDANQDGGAPNATLPVQLTSEEKRALLLAEQELTADCMRERGFQYRVVAAPREEDKEAPRFGTEDVAKARSVGYAIDRSDSEHSHNVPTDANALYAQSLPPSRQQEFNVALFGASDGPQGSVTLPNGQQIGFPLTGCLSDARKRLYGGDVNRFMTIDAFVNNLEGEVARRVRRNGEIIDSLKRWRACMRKRGLDFVDPNEAIETARADASRERAIAVADATCARAADLVDIGRRMLRRYEREVYAEYEGRVIAYNELTDDGLDRARDVLRDP